MAFIGILLANLFLMFILGSAFIAIILFIISMILFSKSKKAQKEGKKNIKKTSAIITLVLNIFFSLPLLITILVASISSKIQNEKKEQFIESIENKVYVKRDEWKKGFEYNDNHLVPVNIFMNSDNYNSNGEFKNLDKIGALVIKNTNSYYNLYELENDSGYEMYFVWVESFAGGEYYTRTFVDENDYDSVLKYYETVKLESSVLWKSAPADTKFRNVWQRLDLSLDDSRDELIELSHEVLDDSNKKRGSTSSEDYDNSMEFEIRSTDRVFTIDLAIYANGNEVELYLNDYEVEDKTVEKHKAMLLDLMNKSQEELLNKVNE